MKSEWEIIEMMRAIRDGNSSGMLESVRATAQLVVLGWVLECLPPAAMEAQDALTSGASPEEILKDYLRAAACIKETVEAINNM